VSGGYGGEDRSHNHQALQTSHDCSAFYFSSFLEAGSRRPSIDGRSSNPTTFLPSVTFNLLSGPGRSPFLNDLTQAGVRQMARIAHDSDR